MGQDLSFSLFNILLTIPDEYGIISTSKTVLKIQARLCGGVIHTYTMPVIPKLRHPRWRALVYFSYLSFVLIERNIYGRKNRTEKEHKNKKIHMEKATRFLKEA